MKDYNLKTIKKELMIDAKALSIPSGAAEIFIEHALTTATKALARKTIITEKDLQRAISKELQKYNSDLAYVYKNRDTIV